jgi:hypothetical protein
LENESAIYWKCKYTILAWAGSLARLGHPLDVSINWTEFKDWLKQKYSKQYVATTYSYAKRFYHFNKIIELCKQNRLEEYYDFNLNCLMHFRYSKEFIRVKKNAFISFIPKQLILEIARSKTVSYNAIRKKLERKGIKTRINELRDFYGTFMLHHGLLEQEVNLLQGRIPPSIFVKHYWSPKLSELRDRVFKALNELEQTL